MGRKQVEKVLKVVYLLIYTKSHMDPKKKLKGLGIIWLILIRESIYDVEIYKVGPKTS